jgi:hypothetical protein
MAGGRMRSFSINDFSGGWNPRDAWSQVGDNESPDCLNVTLDERGGIVKRLGLLKYNSTQLGTDAFENLFYWQTQQYLIAQQGTTLYYSTGDGVWTTTTRVFSTSARVGMCDFQGRLCVVHPVDGVWVSTNGTTWTQTTGGTNNMEAVRGNCIAAWQNKLWVGGDPNNKPRVWFSAAGDATTWTIATAWVDIRDKDDAIVTAIGAGSGMDSEGRPGLLVFKDESHYRINNSSTGAYTTVDTQYGASGPLAIASTLGITCAISKRGIVAVNASGGEAVLVSDKLTPLFNPNQIAFAQAANMCAGVYRDRLVFSLARAGSTTNNLTLEYSPQVGWIVPHGFGASAFAMYRKNDEKLYSAGPTSGYAFETFKGGDDNGTAITARYQTRWFEPGRGNACRFRRMIVNGRGEFSLYVKRDYTSGQGELNEVAIVGDAFVWGTGIWGTGIWGPDIFQEYQEFHSLGLGRAVSFELTESSATSVTGPKLLDDGASPELGAFACYGLTIDYVNLGS